MNKRFVASIVAGGILGGAIVLTDEEFCFFCNKITIADEYKRLRIPYHEIASVSVEMVALIFPVAKIVLKNDRTYRFVIFNKKGFLHSINQMVSDKMKSSFNEGNKKTKDTRKSIFSILSFVVILLIALMITRGIFRLGTNSTFSGTKTEYSGEEDKGNWSGNYRSLNGTMRKKIDPETNTLHIQVETNSGTLSIEITDKENQEIFTATCNKTESFEVTVSGKVTVKIKAEHHSGSFSILSGM